MEDVQKLTDDSCSCEMGTSQRSKGLRTPEQNSGSETQSGTCLDVVWSTVCTGVCVVLVMCVLALYVGIQ